MTVVDTVFAAVFAALLGQAFLILGLALIGVLLLLALVGAILFYLTLRSERDG